MTAEHTSPTAQEPALSMRLVDARERAVRELAALDAKPVPAGPALLAEVDGAPRAALPLDGGPAIADPFAPTAELIPLLRLRAAQLAGADMARRGRRRPLEALALVARAAGHGRPGRREQPRTAL